MFAVGTGGMSVIAFEMETWPGGRQAGRQFCFHLQYFKNPANYFDLGLAVSSGI